MGRAYEEGGARFLVRTDHNLFETALLEDRGSEDLGTRRDSSLGQWVDVVFCGVEEGMEERSRRV